MTDFKNNPAFAKVYEMKSGVKLYAHAQSSEVHVSRFVAANAQNIYSGAGATKEFLSAIIEKMLDLVNDDKSNTKRIKSDISVMCNNIRYRLQYPVDEDCLIRMGALYTYLEGEDPDKVLDSFTNKKMQYAKEDSGLYDFFILLGLNATEAYKPLLPVTNVSEYLTRRKEALQALTLPPSLIE